MTRLLRKRPHGMTLIEVMVAITIFAILGIITYRAVASMAQTRAHMDEQYARWRAIARTSQMIEADLMQLAQRPRAGTQPATPALSLVVGGTLTELRLTRLDGASGTLQRRGYRVEDGVLWLSRFPDLNDAAKPREDKLLDNVASMKWRFLNDTGQEYENWPPNHNPTASDVLPSAVRMDLELNDVGTLTRLFPLR